MLVSAGNTRLQVVNWMRSLTPKRVSDGCVVPSVLSPFPTSAASIEDASKILMPCDFRMACLSRTWSLFRTTSADVHASQKASAPEMMHASSSVLHRWHASALEPSRGQVQVGMAIPSGILTTRWSILRVPHWEIGKDQLYQTLNNTLI